MKAADYHERTKHRLDGYAAGPGHMDWADQPIAFRDYGPCPQITLAPADPETAPGFAELDDGLRLAPEPLSKDALGRLLYCSFAIAAWKSYGASRWALRCNPSSGNLHPTEAYLVLPDTNGINGGLYHYRPQDHRLERRCTHATEFSANLFQGQPVGAFLLGLSSIPWREAWKYGERAWRYCLLDLGHAVAALRYSAALLGWQVSQLEQVPDRELASLLGLDRQQEFIPEEPEYPECLCLVTPAYPMARLPFTLPRDLAAQLSNREWHGKANQLSRYHHHRWPVVDDGIRGSEKGQSTLPETIAPVLATPLPYHCKRSAVALIRGRRSAQAFDGLTGLSSREFFAILDHTLPRANLLPWGARPQRARAHLILFVHRIEGLTQGLYALARDTKAVPQLMKAMRAEFGWERVLEAPEHLPLHRLASGDSRQIAARFACQQDIASDGAFVVAMLGEFENGLAIGSWGYRKLMMEAGTIGQTIYLGAEACGLQGTGIGCFFDDALHELFGLRGREYQVLYQFTVGKGLEDTRIASEPTYPDL